MRLHPHLQRRGGPHRHGLRGREDLVSPQRFFTALGRKPWNIQNNSETPSSVGREIHKCVSNHVNDILKYEYFLGSCSIPGTVF